MESTNPSRNMPQAALAKTQTCPICKERIASSQWEAHYASEVATLDSSTCLPAKRRIQQIRQNKKYLKVKGNRLKRSSFYSKDPVKRSSFVESEKCCFICNHNLNGKSEQEINSHVDKCLAKAQEDESEEEFEEYTWAGVTRVRATTMLQGNFSEAGFTVGKQTDEDEDVDVDGVQGYGDAVFGEDSILNLTKDEPTFDEETAVNDNELIDQGILYP